jgi:hypothetical protein
MIAIFSTFFLMDDNHFGVILEVFNMLEVRRKLISFSFYHPYQHVEKVVTFPKEYVSKFGYKDMKHKSSIILLYFQLHTKKNCRNSGNLFFL